MTLVDGLIFEGHGIVVPKALRREMLNRIHFSRMSVNKYIKLTRVTLLWLMTTNEIKKIYIRGSNLL